MKKYTVVNRPLFFKGGILALTKEQVAPRKHALKHIRGNRYEVTGEVCFKINEQIGYDGPVSKAAQTNLEEVGAKSKENEKVKSEKLEIKDGDNL